MNSESQEKIVKQAAQVVELLEFFANFGRPATLAEVSRHLGWPRSSTYNLLMTLARLGYLYEPALKGGFFPSTRWASMVEKIRLAEPPSEAMQNLLAHVSQITGETAVIGVISGTQALFYQVHESTSLVRFTAAVGQTVPLFATVLGRALLAQLTKAQRENVLRKTKFTQFTPKTLMSLEDIEADISASLERGWFQGSEGYSENLAGIAVPLAMPPYSYALLVSGPTERMKDRMSEIGATLRDAVEEYLRTTPQLPDRH
ncbi:IclR family transcriptional regulator [uncultured Roseibium sp.]|uniref:IclR family transcriptional regulator n=1 Tax=uncultured Roseibium sp. TaxID=1936171 RepID=UPI0032171CBB